MTQAPTILVVEDNAITRKMLRLTLEAEGYDVVEAGDARSALAKARESMPDLVLQDLVLPDIDGYELLSRLRALPGGKEAKIVALSGFASHAGQTRAMHAGFTLSLLKPIEPSQLVEVLKKLVPPPDDGNKKVGGGQRIIAVDHEPAELKRLRLHLVQHGFQVTAVSSVTEALRAAETSSPQAIVARREMPEVDGAQLRSLMRGNPQLASVPVLLYPNGDRFETLIPALIETIERGAPTPAEPISDAAKLENARALIGQLKRQLAATDGLARRCTLQAAQLSLLGGMADALSEDADLGAAIHDVFAAMLDSASISQGALYLRDENGVLRLREAIGFNGGPKLDSQFEQIVRKGSAVTTSTPPMEIIPIGPPGKGMGAIVLASSSIEVADDALSLARAIGNQIVQAVELKMSFAKLSASEQRYRTLMEGASDAICVVGLDGIVREANPRYQELVARPGEQVIGKHVLDLERFRKMVAAGGGRSPSPFELKRPDDSVVLLQFSYTIIDLGGEKLVLSIARDITEEVRTHAQLLMSDRMVSVGMLAAGVAHEINNPLTAVSANIDLAIQQIKEVRDQVPPGALKELEAELSDAGQASERVRHIVRDLRVFSRSEEERLDRVDVHFVLDSSLRMGWNEIRHRARALKSYGEVPLVLANEARLGQVFLNLIVNAAQAIPEGHADVNEIRVSTRFDPATRMVVVEIADTGSGMTPGTMKKLFSPFFTTKPQGVGTGLGLAISLRIITALGGEISVTSELGKGSSFRVSLPAAAQQEVVMPPPVRAISPVPITRAKILVVDDEAMIGSAVRRLLRGSHEVTVIHDAREALAQIKSGMRFDVILCDLMMPVMTGMELYSELAKLGGGHVERMIFLTGGAFTPSARAFLEQVSNERLEKPFDVEALRVLVNTKLGG